MVVNGRAHGPGTGSTTCQLYMRQFSDGETIRLEPFRATAFPVIKDLVSDRSAFDRIIQAGGFVSVNAGNAPDGNALPVPKTDAELAMDYAACIGCGACVAACKNGSPMLFIGAKIAHLGHTPQGKVEEGARTVAMIAQADSDGFGSCSNQRECEAVCPKSIPFSVIPRTNRIYAWAGLQQ
jgi:succinate dehydrogenase / fumarate reductase iron-sulfur subunit